MTDAPERIKILNIRRLQLVTGRKVTCLNVRLDLYDESRTDCGTGSAWHRCARHFCEPYLTRTRRFLTYRTTQAARIAELEAAISPLIKDVVRYAKRVRHRRIYPEQLPSVQAGIKALKGTTNDT